MSTPITALHVDAETWLIPETPEGQELLDTVGRRLSVGRRALYGVLEALAYLVFTFLACKLWWAVTPGIVTTFFDPHPDPSRVWAMQVPGTPFVAVAALFFSVMVGRKLAGARDERTRKMLEDSPLAVLAPPMIWGQTPETERQHRRALDEARERGRPDPKDPFPPLARSLALEALPAVDGVPALSILWHAGRQGHAQEVSAELLERLEDERATHAKAEREHAERAQEERECTERMERRQALAHARDAAIQGP